jgi:molybdate transport system ATP-binding protein
MSLDFNLSLPRRDWQLKLEGRFDSGTTGIFGPSGAGKSSLFALLAGLTQPRQGTIRLGNRILVDTAKGHSVPASKRRVGLVFQDKRLFPHLSVEENLRFPLRYLDHPLKKTEANCRQQKITEVLELNHLLQALPGNLSGGEAQRVAIGRALMSDPELLLMDEPFNALHSGLRKNLFPYLRRLEKEWQITTLVISHDFTDLQQLTQSLYYIEKGRCLGHGSAYDLWHNIPRIRQESEFLNTFPICRETTDFALGIAAMKGCQGLGTIKTRSLPETVEYLFLPPEEVALSLKSHTGLSIQNQLPGTIKRLIHRRESVYAVLDLDEIPGIPLVARITQDAVEDLGLLVGKPLWALFKAQALGW